MMQTFLRQPVFMITAICVGAMLMGGPSFADSPQAVRGERISRCAADLVESLLELSWAG
jgi:hypothetical protein